MTNKEYKKQRKINIRLKQKLALIFSVIVLALVGLSVRIVYINETNGDKYTKKVLQQQESNSLTLAYRRGDIYDRNGTVLATSEKVYNIISSDYKDDNNESDNNYTWIFIAVIVLLVMINIYRIFKNRKRFN